MRLQPTYRDIVSQKEFMRNAVGMEFKTGGGVLDVSEFGDVAEDGYIQAGTAVGKNSDGFYVPFDGEEDLDGAGLTASEISIDEDETNAVVGIVVAGHPLERKCHNVSDDFKDAVEGYLRFDV